MRSWSATCDRRTGLVRCKRNVRFRALRGMTLVELMIVIGLLGVLATLAAPSFSEFRLREQVKGAANNLYTDLQFARSESVQRNRAVSVSVTSGSSWCYGIHEGNTQCDCETAGSCSIKTVSSSDFNNVQIDEAAFGSQAWYVIDPRRGQIIDDTGAAASGTVTFTAGGGKDLRAAVNAVGRVSLCAPSGKIGGYPTCQ